MPIFKAVTITELPQKTPLTLVDFEEPSPGPNEILIENVAVAQNPVDWKQVDYGIFIPSLPWTHGGDVAGVVYKVGSNVKKFRVGDRVISFLTRETARHGGFQTYSLAAQDRTVKLPESVSFEEGSTIPLAYVTAAAGIVEGLGLSLPLDGPLPAKPNGEVLLVWGGSSSVGSFVIQIAKLSGYTVLTTASPANFEYVKSLGADHVFDHRDAEVVNKIRAAAGNKLSLVYDAISENGSTEASVRSVTAPTGTVAVILDFEPTAATATVKVARTNAAAAEIPAIGKVVYELLDKALSQGVLKPNRVKVIPGGLHGVNEGHELGRKHKVSGEKLVYRVAETKF